MMIPFPKPRVIRMAVWACMLVVGLTHIAHGQIKVLKNVADNGSSNVEAPDTPEEIRARIDQWHQDAKDALAKLDSPAASTVVPDGITSLEFDDRRRRLEGMQMISAQWLKSIEAEQDAINNPDADAAEEWSGFKESPPYSILMVDELLNDRDAVSDRLKTSESSLTNYQRILAGIIEETKDAEEKVNAGMLGLQKADDATKDAAKWRLEAAREYSRLLAARSALFQRTCEGLKKQIASIKDELMLIDRKITIASANSSFSDQDFAKLNKISSDRKVAIQKESDSINKRLQAAKADLVRAQAALDKFDISTTADVVPEEFELAKFRVEVIQERIDTLQVIGEWIEGLPQLENIIIEAYENRREIINATTPRQRSEALASLNRILNRIQAWENVLENDISNAESDLGQLEFRAQSISRDDPRFSLFNEQRAIKSERLASSQRLSKSVIALSKLINRWVEEYSPKPEDEGMFPRIKMFGANAWTIAKKVWSFEVMKPENSVVVDGQTVTGYVSVTLGMLLRALLFFIVGYQIASRIAQRIQTSLVSRGHIPDAQARTLRNWAMIVVSVILVVGTMAFLSIPLTVFAYAGGALAIGLGFGLQTLIKNFISGIIVLAERKVRVGDILDVDGIIGTVVEVNTRSSVIRSPDDVETMIPNSLFLENRVTNWTLSSSKMRRKLTVGVAYGTSPQVVMEVLTEAASRHGLIVKEPAPFAVFEDFGDSALIFTLYFWMNMHGGGNAMVITSDLRLMIEKRFGELEISVPFPQRDLNINPDKPIQIQMAPAPETTPDE